MLNCLKPVRLAVGALSNHDANLLTSEEIFKFLFSNLEKYNSDFSSSLFKEIKNELLKRKNKVLVSVVKFSSNASYLYGVERTNICFDNHE
jgi:hypothetical protein